VGRTQDGKVPGGRTHFPDPVYYDFLQTDVTRELITCRVCRFDLRARKDDSLALQLRRVSHHGRNIFPTQRWIEPQDLITGLVGRKVIQHHGRHDARAFDARLATAEQKAARAKARFRYVR
jgi:hypothetical protein